MAERISASLYTSDDGEDWHPFPGISVWQVSAYAVPRIDEALEISGELWRVHDIIWHVKTWQTGDDADTVDIHVMPDDWIPSDED